MSKEHDDGSGRALKPKTCPNQTIKQHRTWTKSLQLSLDTNLKISHYYKYLLSLNANFFLRVMLIR